MIVLNLRVYHLYPLSFIGIQLFWQCKPNKEIGREGSVVSIRQSEQFNIIRDVDKIGKLLILVL